MLGSELSRNIRADIQAKAVTLPAAEYHEAAYGRVALFTVNSWDQICSFRSHALTLGLSPEYFEYLEGI